MAETMTGTTFDRRMSRIESGERLTEAEIREMAAAPDILPLGMLADALRRRIRGSTVTFVRVATCRYDASFTDAVLPAAREVLITGDPESMDVAVAAVRAARAVAGDRTVAGFSWPGVERLAGGIRATRAALDDLRAAGLDAVAELPLDAMDDADAAVEQLRGAGFQQLRLTVRTAESTDLTSLWLRAAALQDRYACIQTLSPLPTVLQPLRPTTGYQDVKAVAAARLAAPNIPCIQVDWMRYGSKLAQVALTFGADDIYGVSADDAAPEGRRRAVLEEIRRNVEAAGFEPVERDGRFTRDG